MNDKPPIPDDLTREAMWDIILELRAELEAARAEIADLKSKLAKPKKTSRNSSVPPSQTIKERRENRRASRGGKPGHEGKSRSHGKPDRNCSPHRVKDDIGSWIARLKGDPRTS